MPRNECIMDNGKVFSLTSAICRPIHTTDIYICGHLWMWMMWWRTRRYARRRCRLRARAPAIASVVCRSLPHRHAQTQPDRSTTRSRRSVKHAVIAVPLACVISAECSASTTTCVSFVCEWNTRTLPPAQHYSHFRTYPPFRPYDDALKIL